MIIAEDDKPTGEDLLVCDNVGGPIKRMAAIVDCAATLGLLMDRTKELPLGGAHFRAGVGATRRGIEKETDDKGIALGDKKPAKFVEPDSSVDIGRRLSKLQRGCARERLGIGRSVITVQGS